MNFFENQHQARQKTWLLVFYFVVAVTLIIAVINCAVFIAYGMAADHPPAIEDWLAQPYWEWIALATLAVIGLGTLSTVSKLRGGGRAVAELAGARPIDPSSKDADERKLINVVEEMSIASGTPVPALYVLDSEPAINAFVAGLRPTEAVLVVTRGALQTLSRDELQGVIGHEYSHILNGDMRINLRLMGIVAGILLIGQIGRVILRATDRGSGKSAFAAMMIGLALFIVGYIGLFFGSLIKAAVSRQRELLADASSVQFTRNPSGITGALWKIKGHAEGSLLTHNAHADDLNHFCFGDAIAFKLSSLMATHPPLDERIRAIDPGFIAQAKAGRLQQRDRAGAPPAAGPVPAGASGFAGAASMPIGATREQLVGSVGSVTPAHMDFAQALHASLPAGLMTALHEPAGARAAIYSLLLNATADGQRQKGVDLIRAAENAATVAVANGLAQVVAGLKAQQRLPIVNMALPALRTMPPQERARLLSTAEAVIQADGRYTVFEFALLAILREHLREDARKTERPRYFKYEAVLPEIRLLLSVMARVGSDSEAVVKETFQRIAIQFSRDATEPEAKAKCSLRALNDALHKLNLLAPLLKKSVIEACTDCVIHDGKVLPGEAELLQAVAVVLDCPMPPLLG